MTYLLGFAVVAVAMLGLSLGVLAGREEMRRRHPGPPAPCCGPDCDCGAGDVSHRRP